jgi:hypothetical protein
MSCRAELRYQRYKEFLTLTMQQNLSDNNGKQSQINAVVVQQEEVDRVDGFEPTTAAMPRLRRGR